MDDEEEDIYSPDEGLNGNSLESKDASSATIKDEDAEDTKPNPEEEGEEVEEDASDSVLYSPIMHSSNSNVLDCRI